MANETKWTPGERWVRPLLSDEHAEVRDWRLAVAVRGKAGPLALVGSEDEGRLIAAAPDLYEALAAVGSCEVCGEDYGRCMACDARIIAALAKARGE